VPANCSQRIIIKTVNPFTDCCSTVWTSSIGDFTTGVNSLINSSNLSFSGKWESVFTTVLGNSANWESPTLTAIETSDIIDFEESVNQLINTSNLSNSANWDSVYSSFNSNSSLYSSNYTTVNTNSANWNYQGTDIKSVTGGWTSTQTTVNTKSSNWDRSYNTVNTNSANWNYQGTDIKSLTAGWINSQTTVNTNSANWNSVYSTMNSYSASWSTSGPITSLVDGISDYVYPQILTQNLDGSIYWSLSSGPNARVLLYRTGRLNVTTPMPGESGSLIIKIATNGATLSGFDSKWLFSNGTSTLNTVLSAYNVLSFIYDGVDDKFLTNVASF